MRLAHLIVPSVLLAACTGEGSPAADSPAATAVADSAVPAPPADAWVVTERGAGPVEIGMTAAEVDGVPAAPPPAGSSCTYATPPGAPAGLRVMLVDGRVVRVDVDSGPAATAAGARVGDPESRVLALYEGRIMRMPHKYQTAGAYLTVTPGAPQDTLHQIIFETDGRVVTRYRAGTLPQVAWVERCG